ncbi:MAG: polyprenyl diphosphate synthase [Anaerolineaceae bacterium]
MENMTNPDVIIPRHLGIIMDGNGRWAQARGLPRSAGHQAGVQSARRIIEACAGLGIQVLTLYAFSTENWSRPEAEVDYIMSLVEQYAIDELPELQRNGIRFQLMGRREGLPNPILNALDRMIAQTCDNSRLIFNLAFNYGGRSEIADAIKTILTAADQDGFDASDLDENTIARYLYCSDCPDVDLIIRTSGEWRLSNFLLWRASNAVFITTPVYWPDFQQEHLLTAIRRYTQFISMQDAVS